MKSLRHGTPLHHLGVDLDGLHARLVRVADGGLADGVVAAARAEHLFVALRCARRAAELAARGTAHFVSQRSSRAAEKRCSARLRLMRSFALVLAIAGEQL